MSTSSVDNTTDLGSFIVNVLIITSPLLFGLTIALVAYLVSKRQTERRSAAESEAAERRRAAEQEAEGRRKEAEERRKKFEEEFRRTAEQRALAERLDKINLDSARIAQKLPVLVKAAENKLNIAEQEFEGGYFAPFWDAAEGAVRRLAEFETITAQLLANSMLYHSEASKLATPPPPFKLGLQTLPDASHAADRMRTIVRRAQKDPNFATIYEQRRTNSVLVEGFSTLGDAIYGLGGRLDSSLERLASSVGEGISDLTHAHESMALTLEAELKDLKEQAASEAAAQCEHERKALEQAESDSAAQREHEREELEMLDNIQRHKKPKP